MQFGSDIVMALDVCVGYQASNSAQRDAMELTHRWLPRNLTSFGDHIDMNRTRRSLLFGICQGGFNAERRSISARVIADSPVDGCAIGGLSVGEPKDVMADMLESSIAELDSARPRYLMGVGSPEDLWNAVAVGVDMFDCVLPTRVARRGALYTSDGRVIVTSQRYATLDRPVDPDCDCYTCRTFSVAYLHHLFRTKELLAYRLGSIHNLRFLMRQMDAMRAAIQQGVFDSQHRAFIDRYQVADQAVAAEQRARYRQRQTRP